MLSLCFDIPVMHTWQFLVLPWMYPLLCLVMLRCVVRYIWLFVLAKVQPVGMVSAMCVALHTALWLFLCSLVDYGRNGDEYN